MWSDIKYVSLLHAVTGLNAPTSFSWVSHLCTLPMDPQVPYKLRLGHSDFAWVLFCSTVLSPVSGVTSSCIWLNSLHGLCTQLTLLLWPRLSMDPINSACLCPAVQTTETALGSEGTAWAVVTLTSWSVSPRGSTLLLLLPDNTNLSMVYCGDSSCVRLQFSYRGNPLPARTTPQMI